MEKQPPDARELDRLRSQNAQLRVDAQRYRKLRQSLQRKPAAQKAAVLATPFALQDPRRKPKIGTKVLPALTAPLMLARKMGAAIGRELREMTIETRALVKQLARDPDAHEELCQAQGAMDAPPDGSTAAGKAQQRLEMLQARWKARFAALAEEWSRRMITDVLTQSTAQLTIGLKDVAERSAIQSTLAMPRMRAVVQAAAQSSTQLISRIPERYLGEVQVAVMSAITTGSGLGELVPYLTARYENNARHARLVALDQIRKVSANVNATRLQDLGIKSYIWVHVGGERFPRHLHLELNGREFRYDDPPVIQEARATRSGKGKGVPRILGKPGDLISCRCIARPVVRFTELAPS